MANWKNKRGTKSGKRGKGKNHSVNKEKSYADRKKARLARMKLSQRNDRHRRLKLAVRLHMTGVCQDYGEALNKAFAVNSNFFKNPEIWF